MSRRKKLTPAEEGEMAVLEDALAEAKKKNATISSEPHEQVVERMRKLTPAEEGERTVAKEEK